MLLKTLTRQIVEVDQVVRKKRNAVDHADHFGGDLGVAEETYQEEDQVAAGKDEGGEIVHQGPVGVVVHQGEEQGAEDH